MKKHNRGLRVLAAVAGVAIVVGLAAGMASVLGDPISRGISRSKAERYLAETYPEKTLEFEIEHELGGTFRYFCNVKSPESEDTNFHLSLEGFKVVNDDYDYWVNQRRSTQTRLSARLTGDISEALKGKLLEEGIVERLEAYYGVVAGTAGWTMENLLKDEFTLDMPYDKNNIAVPTMLDMSIGTEDPTEEHLAEILQKLKSRMEEKGLRVDYYSIHLKLPGEVVYDPVTLKHQQSVFVEQFPASEIREEGMEEALSAHRLAQEAETEAWYAAGNY